MLNLLGSLLKLEVETVSFKFSLSSFVYVIALCLKHRPTSVRDVFFMIMVNYKGRTNVACDSYCTLDFLQLLSGYAVHETNIYHSVNKEIFCDSLLKIFYLFTVKFLCLS